MLINIFETIGLAAFAASGALQGIKKGLDVFGIFIVAVTTAIGGGIIRDALIGNIPPLSFRSPLPVLISAVAWICTIFIYDKIVRFKNIFLLLDALGLSAFTAIGADIVIEKQMDSLFSVVFFAAVTGIGGGVIRDVMVNKIPLVFRKEIYAVASMAGALTLYFSRGFVSHELSIYICFIVTLIIRVMAFYFNLNLPTIKFRADDTKG